MNFSFVRGLNAFITELFLSKFAKFNWLIYILGTFLMAAFFTNVSVNAFTLNEYLENLTFTARLFSIILIVQVAYSITFGLFAICWEQAKAKNIASMTLFVIFLLLGFISFYMTTKNMEFNEKAIGAINVRLVPQLSKLEGCENITLIEYGKNDEGTYVIACKEASYDLFYNTHIIDKTIIDNAIKRYKGKKEN